VEVTELVEVGGAELHFPFKAVPKPQNLWVEVLLPIALVLVTTEVVLVLVTVLVVVFVQCLDEVDVEITELVVVVEGGLHEPLAAVPNPHQYELEVDVVVDEGALHFPSRLVPKPQ